MTSHFQGTWTGKEEAKSFRYSQLKPSLPLLSTRFVIGGLTVELKTGDVTAEKGKLIVNTANEFLMDGTGVTGAIFQTMDKDVPLANRYDFQDACDLIGYCPPGHCVLVPTPQHKSIPGVIHLVGHPMTSGRENVIRTFYLQAIADALSIASENDLPIAFPSLGTGVYAVPVLVAAEWMFRALSIYADEHENTLMDITIDLFSVQDWHLYRSLWLDLHTAWTQDREV